MAWCYYFKSYVYIQWNFFIKPTLKDYTNCQLVGVPVIQDLMRMLTIDVSHDSTCTTQGSG